jgi:two-component system response regulator FixJ
MSPSPTVHIIDDDEAVRDSLLVLLELNGFAPCAYASADAFLSRNPDDEGCLVTDVQMPDMTGVELLQMLRRRGDARPVIVITARASAALAEAALAAGAAAVLEKPFSPERLLERIRTVTGAGS